MIRASCACALAHFFKISVSPHHNSTRCDQDAQGHNAAHGENATGLPGICDVKFVSHTMGVGITPSAWSRGISKPEKPTQGAPASPAVCAHSGRASGCHLNTTGAPPMSCLTFRTSRPRDTGPRRPTSRWPVPSARRPRRRKLPCT